MIKTSISVKLFIYANHKKTRKAMPALERVQLMVYDNTGHEFTETMWDNILNWFEKYLRI